MAANILTATPEELAKQFPITCRPFAVWYNSDPEADHRKWEVNAEDGCACKEFEDIAAALKTAAEMGKEWDAEARKQAQALAKVTGGGAPPDILEHFYDLRALAMNARALILNFDEGSDELNAARRALSMLEEKALQFANETDKFLLQQSHAARTQTIKEEQAATA